MLTGKVPAASRGAHIPGRGTGRKDRSQRLTLVTDSLESLL